jgi:hypothetical protein
MAPHFAIFTTLLLLLSDLKHPQSIFYIVYTVHFIISLISTNKCTCAFVHLLVNIRLILNSCSSLMVRVAHPSETIGEITVLCKRGSSHGCYVYWHCAVCKVGTTILKENIILPPSHTCKSLSNIHTHLQAQCHNTEDNMNIHSHENLKPQLLYTWDLNAMW